MQGKNRFHAQLSGGPSRLLPRRLSRSNRKISACFFEPDALPTLTKASHSAMYFNSSMSEMGPLSCLPYVVWRSKRKISPPSPRLTRQSQAAMYWSWETVFVGPARSHPSEEPRSKR